MIQTNLDQVLEKKPKGMSNRQWMSLEKKACSVIRECLMCVALYSMLEEKTSKGLWVKVANHVYGEKHVQQADVEEETVQPSDVGRQRYLGSHPEVRLDVK